MMHIDKALLQDQITRSGPLFLPHEFEGGSRRGTTCGAFLRLNRRANQHLSEL
jgi:hypothetical protein